MPRVLPPRELLTEAVEADSGGPWGGEQEGVRWGGDKPVRGGVPPMGPSGEFVFWKPEFLS